MHILLASLLVFLTFDAVGAPAETAISARSDKAAANAKHAHTKKERHTGDRKERHDNKKKDKEEDARDREDRKAKHREWVLALLDDVKAGRSEDEAEGDEDPDEADEDGSEQDSDNTDNASKRPDAKFSMSIINDETYGNAVSAVLKVWNAGLSAEGTASARMTMTNAAGETLDLADCVATPGGRTVIDAEQGRLSCRINPAGHFMTVLIWFDANECLYTGSGELTTIAASEDADGIFVASGSGGVAINPGDASCPDAEN